MGCLLEVLIKAMTFFLNDFFTQHETISLSQPVSLWFQHFVWNSDFPGGLFKVQQKGKCKLKSAEKVSFCKDKLRSPNLFFEFLPLHIATHFLHVPATNSNYLNFNPKYWWLIWSKKCFKYYFLFPTVPLKLWGGFSPWKGTLPHTFSASGPLVPVYSAPTSQCVAPHLFCFVQAEAANRQTEAEKPVALSSLFKAMCPAYQSAVQSSTQEPSAQWVRRQCCEIVQAWRCRPCPTPLRCRDSEVI